MPCANNGILLSHENNEIMPFAATCDHTKVKSVTERQISCHITYMWNPKNDTNELT